MIIQTFDSTTASITTTSFLTPTVSMAMTVWMTTTFCHTGCYSLLDTEGLERIRTSVGQSYYFSDRRVSLNQQPDEFDTQRQTGPPVSVSSQLNQNFSPLTPIQPGCRMVTMPSGMCKPTIQAIRAIYITLGYFYRKILS